MSTKNVWGTSHYFIDGCQRRAIVMAASKKEAAEKLKMSLYMLNQYASITYNAAEIEVANQAHGVVFVKDKWPETKYRMVEEV